MGFDVLAASESNMNIFEDSYKTAAQKKYDGLVPAGWYLEDYHILQGTREENMGGGAAPP